MLGIPVLGPPTVLGGSGPGAGSGFYGVNFDLAGYEQFSSVATGPLLARLEPATIRWPGGTEADFYDWHTGLDVEKPGRVPFTLEDLAAVVHATGAVPIFDLNVLAGDNATDPADQLAMLEAASKLGLPVRYVEIGNELYANGAGFAGAFPTGADYARTVAIYVEALHQAFPGVQVAADAIPFPEDAREQTWDQELVAHAVGAGAPDAFVVHMYPGLYLEHPSASDLPQLFANVYQSVAELSSAVEGLNGTPVWLTEFNFRGPYELFRRYGPTPLVNDFAHELYLAAFAVMLPRISGIALADNWTSLGDAFYGAWQNPRSPYLSPGGQAIEMVDAAAHGATSSVPLSLPGAPDLPGGYPGIVAQLFVRPQGDTAAVFVNLTNRSVAVPSAPWLQGGTRYEQVAGNPLARELTAATPRSGIVAADGIVLAPYSLTVAGAGPSCPASEPACGA